MLNDSLKSRTIKNLGKGFINKSSPSYLILYVNNICQLRCDMCFYWDAMQKKTKQMRMVKDLKKEVETGKHGTQKYVIKQGANKGKTV